MRCEGDAEDWPLLFSLVRWKLACLYGGHPAFEDLLQEGSIAAVEAVRRVRAAGGCAPATAATRAAVWRVCAWLRSGENPERRYTRKGRALPERVSWITAELEEGGVAGDFSGEVIERVAGEATAAALLAHPQLTQVQRALLRRVVMAEEPLATVADALEMDLAAAKLQLAAALALLRKEGKR